MEIQLKVERLLKNKLSVPVWNVLKDKLPVLTQFQRKEVIFIHMQLPKNLQVLYGGRQRREVASSSILLQEDPLSVCVQLVG